MNPIQLLNTAIVKSKELEIDKSYEERLKRVCDSPAIEHINKAISNLADSQSISKEQAAQMIVKVLSDLESIWDDYVVMEGLDKLKKVLGS